MVSQPVVFNDGEGYERFMGRWSREVGHGFIEWLEPRDYLRWLDAGCGTGVFTKLLLDSVRPASLTAIDPSPEQISWAQRQLADSRVELSVADAQALPFPDGRFDVVTSALVIHFIPDPSKGLREMHRVCAPGGMVAGYVWDFHGRRGPGPMGKTLGKLGIETPPIPGLAYTSERAFRDLFVNAGLEDIETRTFDVTVEFADFDDAWISYTPSFRPETKIIAGLPPDKIQSVKDGVRAEMQALPGGRLAYSGRAWAVKARKPA